MRTLVLWSLGATLTLTLAAGASADELTMSLANGQLVTTVEGRANILLPLTAPDVGTNVSLGDVRLRLPRTVVNAERDTRLRIRVLRSSSYNSEADLDGDLSGAAVLPAGGELASVDLSGVIRGVLAGAEMHGLVITTPDGQGFDSREAAVLLGALDQGSIEVSYRRVPPAPRGQRGS